MLIAAWSYAAGESNVTDLMLLAGGLVALPVWLVWTAVLTRTGYGNGRPQNVQASQRS
jgi:ABC-type transport system involved in cytochrome c biogenesis permease subunit